MTEKIFVLHGLLLIQYVYQASAISEQSVKAEAAVPILTLSPPEGNTTFLDGTTWCVALPDVEETALQRALDWACGPGSVDCGYIERGRECYEPNTLLSHASFAFNSYYQQNGNNDIACNFGGVAYVTTHNPSTYVESLRIDRDTTLFTNLFVHHSSSFSIPCVNLLTGHGICRFLVSSE